MNRIINSTFALLFLSISFYGMDEKSSSKLKKLKLSHYLLLSGGKHKQLLYNPGTEKMHLTTFTETMEKLEDCSFDLDKKAKDIQPIGFALLEKDILTAMKMNCKNGNARIILARLRDNTKKPLTTELKCLGGQFNTTDFFFDQKEDAVIVEVTYYEKNKLTKVQLTLLPNNGMSIKCIE